MPDSQNSEETQTSAPSNTPKEGWSGIILLLGFVAAMAAPHIVGQYYGFGWGTLTSVGITGLWICTLPVTCMGGGLIYSLFAISMVCQAILMSAALGIMLIF